MQDKRSQNVLQTCKWEMTLIKKQKPRSTAGRKPAGPFAHNTAQLTIRMPDDLRGELERSAKKRGWSLTQELLWRLESSYWEERDQGRQPAARALCFLVNQIASRVGFFNYAKWHRNPFAFRAFRLAVNLVLEALEPAGDMQNPYKPPPGSDVRVLIGGTAASSFKTPEEFADHMAKMIMDEILHTRPRMEEKRMPRDVPLLFQGIGSDSDRNLMLAFRYGMGDALRDLGIQVHTEGSQ
jgi:hypothetical protein